MHKDQMEEICQEGEVSDIFVVLKCFPFIMTI